ncbi:MAG: hypothetical protein INF92_12505 [Rhodobacter sp.]|nr:hypothetical protein [Rhodobacter sp.]
MHAAGLHSPRLQRVLHLLSDGRPHSTREIVRKAGVMAVSACVSELRWHGATIPCLRQHVDGKPRFFYTMTKGPDLK